MTLQWASVHPSFLGGRSWPGQTLQTCSKQSDEASCTLMPKAASACFTARKKFSCFTYGMAVHMAQLFQFRGRWRQGYKQKKLQGQILFFKQKKLQGPKVPKTAGKVTNIHHSDAPGPCNVGQSEHECWHTPHNGTIRPGPDCNSWCQRPRSHMTWDKRGHKRKVIHVATWGCLFQT